MARKFEKELESFVKKTFNTTNKEADQFINSLEAHIKECVENGETVQWTGLLTLEPYVTTARKGRNPQTGEPIDIPAKNSVKAKVSKVWKKKLAAEPIAALEADNDCENS